MKKGLLPVSLGLACFVLGLFLSILFVPYVVHFVSPAKESVSLILTSQATMLLALAGWALFISSFGFICGFRGARRARTVFLSIAAGLCVVGLALFIQKLTVGAGVNAQKQLFPDNPVTVQMESLHLGLAPLLGAITVCLAAFFLRRQAQKSS